MNSTEYMKNVKRSESSNFQNINRCILHGAIGVCTEAGELMDVIKKTLFYNRLLDIKNLKEEIGDIFWYLGLICNEIGITFEELMDMNIRKLKVRYPNQFKEKDEQTRNYQKEREAAEKGMEENYDDSNLEDKFNGINNG